ncbi:MAG: hypothetical protein ACYCPQ_04825 [Elusimicrobiota bacterium]
MKKSAILALSLAVMSVSIVLAHNGKGGKEVSLKGEIVDMACYLPHAGKGKAHADCAKMCVLAGAPIGLLAQNGIVYLLLEDHMTPKGKKPYEEAKKLIADQALISGDMYQRSGMSAIVVEKAAKR